MKLQSIWQRSSEAIYRKLKMLKSVSLVYPAPDAQNFCFWYRRSLTDKNWRESTKLSPPLGTLDFIFLADEN
ncbi:hypothetical protein [Nostoc sp. PCC 7524]|uniref:hypothetical protein n=1 Tax=Nostoc sp. (strain ATCC 29411 / PCC 7524) TaxID=28072 RepID=UPI00149447EA|nr:hypothetical protein [Nostoc sp. PCC 7524]